MDHQTTAAPTELRIMNVETGGNKTRQPYLVFNNEDEDSLMTASAFTLPADKDLHPPGGRPPREELGPRWWGREEDEQEEDEEEKEWRKEIKEGLTREWWWDGGNTAAAAALTKSKTLMQVGMNNNGSSRLLSHLPPAFVSNVFHLALHCHTFHTSEAHQRHFRTSANRFLVIGWWKSWWCWNINLSSRYQMCKNVEKIKDKYLSGKCEDAVRWLWELVWEQRCWLWRRWLFKLTANQMAPSEFIQTCY